MRSVVPLVALLGACEEVPSGPSQAYLDAATAALATMQTRLDEQAVVLDELSAQLAVQQQSSDTLEDGQDSFDARIAVLESQRVDADVTALMAGVIDLEATRATTTALAELQTQVQANSSSISQTACLAQTTADSPEEQQERWTGVDG